jgi:hypothetical protein
LTAGGPRRAADGGRNVAFSLYYPMRQPITCADSYKMICLEQEYGQGVM